MPRLSQSRLSNNVGLTVSSLQNQNNSGLQNRSSNNIRPQIYKKNVDDMDGEGFKDLINSVYSKGKAGVDYLSNAYSGNLGTTLKNLLPNSDDTGRPSYVGEKHGILELPNGKFGIANYMGPNTNLIERIKRGDPPRTDVDKASQAHDIRYALAKTTDDIRNADNIMMSAVDRISKNRSDSVKNIAQARLIKAKIIGEDLGLIRKDAFSGDLSKSDLNDADRMLLSGKIGTLAQQGYGLELSGQGKLLPGDALKLKLLKQMVKEDKMKLKGTGGAPEGRGYEGRGNDSLLNFVVGNVIPNIMKQVGIPSDSITSGSLKNIITKSLELVKNGNVDSIIDHLSKTILPVLFSLKSKSMSGSGLKLAGQGQIMAGYGKKKRKLIADLSKGLKKSFKIYIKGAHTYGGKTHKGSGLILSGQGKFWEDFKRGFISVFKPGAKILGAITNAVGMPEFGVPLEVISNLL